MAKEEPLIIAFVADLIIESRIRASAQKLGYTLEAIAAAEHFGTFERRDQPGEPLEGGQTANLTRHLSETQPLLLIFDLGNAAIPAERWIAIIKSSPATRRIPVLCFGPHVVQEALEKARDAGADAVVTRGQFSAKLPDLINANVRRHDYAGILTACDQPLSALALEGIALFNAGQYYDAHHGLEAAWNEDRGPARNLYKAILQVAVAYLQIERGNYRGALKMFLRVRQWLDPLPEVCRGVDLAQLSADAEAVNQALVALGQDRIAEFDRSLFRPLRMADGRPADS